jgi:activator of HSP90 ATPase
MRWSQHIGGFPSRCEEEAILNFHDRKSALESCASSNRRRWVTDVAVGLGALFLLPGRSLAAAEDGLTHTAEAIHQEPVFKANPKRIYEALTDAKQFQKIQLIGGAIAKSDLEAKPAEISTEAGGPFTLFGGHIVGRQIELVLNQRIVEAWRETTWDPGWYSIVRFELKEQGTGTKLIFDHTGFPAGAGEHLAVGWKSYYWEPMEKLLA